jgi:hypothetical protein
MLLSVILCHIHSEYLYKEVLEEFGNFQLGQVFHI